MVYVDLLEIYKRERIENSKRDAKEFAIILFLLFFINVFLSIILHG